MLHYIEKFEILGVGRLAIEDYESPGKHFFPNEYKSGRCKRYRLWCGSSFGTTDTLEEAWEGVLRYALDTLVKQRVELSSKLGIVRESLNSLTSPKKDPDIANLEGFQVNPTKDGTHTEWSFGYPKE